MLRTALSARVVAGVLAFAAIAAAVAASLLLRRRDNAAAVSTAIGGTVFPELGDDAVAVRTSGLPAGGKGAFAMRDFAQGERVGFYRCQVGVNTAGDYGWQLNATHSCDGEAIPRRNPMRYVNSIALLDTCGLQNVKMRLAESDPRRPEGDSLISYVATRRIRRGEELLVDYGALYFMTRPSLLAVGARYECGASAIQLASMRGDVDAVRALLKGLERDAATAAVNERGSFGWTLLMEAAAVGAGNVARLLIQHGARVNDKGALSIASHNRQVEVVQILLQEGARVDQAKSDGATPLFVASEKGHAEVVRVLLKEGARVDQAKSNGATPLFIASQDGHTEVVRLLLKEGARADQATSDGAAPLFVASEKGHTEVVRVLLKEGGAPVDQAFSRNGATPLFVASKEGHTEVVRVLLQQGARVDQAAANGVTSLIIASYSGNVEVVRVLLREGARADQATPDGATPQLVARQQGHAEVVDVLRQHIGSVGS